MIIRLEETPSQSEIEILVKYPQMNETVQKIDTLLHSINQSVKCSIGSETHWISASDIYYIESVDKHTFIYCKEAVYESDLRLYQLLDLLCNIGFVQVSKSCILNLYVLEHIKPLINSRLEATLSNGERIYITRKYIPEIRKKLEGR